VASSSKQCKQRNVDDLQQKEQEKKKNKDLSFKYVPAQPQLFRSAER